MNVCAFLTILFMLLPIAAAQTRPTTDEMERQADLKRLEAEAAALPQMRADSIEQVVRFGVEENMLTARSLLSPGEKQFKIIVPDMRGIVRLTMFGPPDAGEAAARNFQLIQQDLTDPSAGEVITMISAVAGRLILSRDAESGQFVSSVQLLQDPPPLPGARPEEPPVRLLVHRSDLNGRENDLELKLAANDFTELLRKYPRELNLYLRPILCEFRQEAAVFAVPPQIAWQVLGRDYAPDEQMVARVKSLIDKLDSEDFRQREAAVEHLKALGQPAATVLSKMDRGKLSLQQSSGIDSFLAEFAPLAREESQRLGRSMDFLIDALYNDDPMLRRLALDRLSKLTGRHIELDPRLDPAARSEAIAKLRHELIPTTQPVTQPSGS